jgi:hypothetical protein
MSFNIVIAACKNLCGPSFKELHYNKLNGLFSKQVMYFILSTNG